MTGARLKRFASQAYVLLAIELVIIVACWQIAVAELDLVNPVFLPAPTEIWVGFKDLVETGDLWTNIQASFTAYVLGLSLAIVVGVFVGLLLGSFVPVDKLVGPVLWAVYAVPWLAYRPLSVVWFGFGSGPVIFLAFVAAVFPIVINTAAGARTVNPSFLNAGRVFGMRTPAIFQKIVIPSTLPFIFVGVRQSAILAALGVLVAELTGSAEGVGALISLSTNSFQTERAFAAIAMAIVWMFFVGELLKHLSNRLGRWNTTAEQR